MTIPLGKVLIANRGEIACRVMRTCRAWQIPTVAVYSNADGPHSRHALAADTAIPIGIGPTASDSYLLADNLIQVALEQGVQAIHPGYGFLSENATFCERVTGAGLTWIGPPAKAIVQMGDKAASKRIMEEAGVPVTPGYSGSNQETDYLRAQALQTGFPLLIKAVSGGGGKGMRLVHSESDFVAALESCRRESLNAFGDDRVLLEKYLVNPRHVEVQILADTVGNAVALAERDCSLQRRHQKIIEEAPASDLSKDIRDKLGAAGTRAAQAVGYVNAGTVEFLLCNNEFYFCEMNTRLQVEHPITEAITGIDLVEWQLRVAAGETLPFGSTVETTGHAMEARIYAEDPAKNFLPATGTVWHHVPPAKPNVGFDETTGIRVDTGLVSNQEISVFYDPMISKLIVKDENRAACLRKLIRALKDYQIAGVPTNIDFLIKCAQHPTFQQAGAIHTGFLDENAVVAGEEKIPPHAIAMGSLAVLLFVENRIGSDGSTHKAPWSQLWGSWRMGTSPQRILQTDDGTDIVCRSRRDGSFDIQWEGSDGKSVLHHISGSIDGDGGMKVVLDNTTHARLRTVIRDDHELLRVRMWLENGSHWGLDVVNPTSPAQLESSSSVGEGSVVAPMPGTIRRVQHSVGDVVERGDVVVVMEAMKMEHSCSSNTAGVVVDICCHPGDVVDEGKVLFVVEEDKAETA